MMKTKSRPQLGFSLVEMMVSVVVLTIIVGSIFGGLRHLQHRAKTEENKLDTSQSSREFLDEFTRDLHNSGFPNVRMYLFQPYYCRPSATCASPNPDADIGTAVGIVSFSPTQVVFEGDIDNDGSVESVRYRINPDDNGNCPCTIERSAIRKVSGSPITIGVGGQTNPVWNVALERVINSGNTYPIAGTASVVGTNGHTMTALNYSSAFATERAKPVFEAFASDGSSIATCNSAGGCDISASRAAVRSIRSIRVNLNIISRSIDPQTGLPPVISAATSARLNNYF